MKSFLTLGLSCLCIFIIELSVGIGLDRHYFHYLLIGIATLAFSLAGVIEYKLSAKRQNSQPTP